jgi:hypothetical protein
MRRTTFCVEAACIGTALVSSATRPSSANARELIQKQGFWRRKEKLEDAESAL